MRRVFPFLSTVLVLACLTSVGCDSGELRPVWIAQVSPGPETASGALLSLRGQGFGSADIPVDITAVRTGDAGSLAEAGELFAEENAVYVGGEPARVLLRRDSRIDLIVPDLPDGPAFVLVRTEGISSNAYPIRVAAAPEETGGQ